MILLEWAFALVRHAPPPSFSTSAPAQMPRHVCCWEHATTLRARFQWCPVDARPGLACRTHVPSHSTLAFTRSTRSPMSGDVVLRDLSSALLTSSRLSCRWSNPSACLLVVQSCSLGPKGHVAFWAGEGETFLCWVVHSPYMYG